MEYMQYPRYPVIPEDIHKRDSGEIEALDLRLTSFDQEVREVRLHNQKVRAHRRQVLESIHIKIHTKNGSKRAAIENLLDEYEVERGLNHCPTSSWDLLRRHKWDLPPNDLCMPVPQPQTHSLWDMVNWVRRSWERYNTLKGREDARFKYLNENPPPGVDPRLFTDRKAFFTACENAIRIQHEGEEYEVHGNCTWTVGEATCGCGNFKYQLKVVLSETGRHSAYPDEVRW